jgi:hypothetical protein
MVIKFLKRFFRKKPKKIENPYVYMGSLGISPEQMISYKNSVDKIKEFENKWLKEEKNY